jgi:quinol monooxygenase YgiN
MTKSTQGTIRVVARFQVRPDKVDEFIAAARRGLVEPTRKEPGCIAYDLCQDSRDPTQLAMIEEWETQQALDAHLAQPSLRETLAQLMPLGTGSVETHFLRTVA